MVITEAGDGKWVEGLGWIIIVVDLRMGLGSTLDMGDRSHNLGTTAVWALVAWAGAGFVVSLIVHVAAIVGVDVLDDLHGVWLAMFWLAPVIAIGAIVAAQWEKKPTAVGIEELPQIGRALGMLRRG